MLLSDKTGAYRVARLRLRRLRVSMVAAAIGAAGIAAAHPLDVVGAGDSLAAALLAGLLGTGVTSRAALEALPDEDLLRLVDDAALVAALNCTRVGADPPTRAEVSAARAGR